MQIGEQVVSGALPTVRRALAAKAQLWFSAVGMLVSACRGEASLPQAPSVAADAATERSRPSAEGGSDRNDGGEARYASCSPFDDGKALAFANAKSLSMEAPCAPSTFQGTGTVTRVTESVAPGVRRVTIELQTASTCNAAQRATLEVMRSRLAVQVGDQLHVEIAGNNTPKDLWLYASLRTPQEGLLAVFYRQTESFLSRLPGLGFRAQLQPVCEKPSDATQQGMPCFARKIIHALVFATPQTELRLNEQEFGEMQVGGRGFRIAFSQAHEHRDLINAYCPPAHTPAEGFLIDFYAERAD
jgi:hypothetical protein